MQDQRDVLCCGPFANAIFCYLVVAADGGRINPYALDFDGVDFDPVAPQISLDAVPTLAVAQMLQHNSQAVITEFDIAERLPN